MSYIDDGDTNASCTILFLHGNPTWSYLYRHLLKMLKKRFRVVAPDLIGFGLSDKPKELSTYDISTHVEAVLNLIQALKLQGVILVGQDWGGPIATLVAQRTGADCQGLILMNTYIPGVDVFSQAGRRFLKTRLGKFAVINLDLFRRAAFRLGFKQPVERKVMDAYMFPHAKRKDRLGVWAFPAQIPDRNLQDESMRVTMRNIEDYLYRNKTPKLLLFSDADPVFPLNKIRKAKAYIKNAKYYEIKNAGHFLQEDQPQQIGQLIQDWIAGNQSQ